MAAPLIPQLITLLKTDQTPELDGFFIVKLRLSREAKPVAEGLRWRRFPGGQRGAVITHPFGDRTLQAVLLHPQGDFLPKNEVWSLPKMPVAEFQFSPSEVEQFVWESGDENPNHRGENAVVPGLLLARIVDATLAEQGQFLEEFEFRFLESLPVNQSLVLIRETKTRWLGQNVAGRRVLELTFTKPSG